MMIKFISNNNYPICYICPFNGEDCIRMNSLSMNKTIFCNCCEIYYHQKTVDNNVKLSDSDFRKSLDYRIINN